MTVAAQIIVWTCFGLIVYAYAVYPACLGLLAWLRARAGAVGEAASDLPCVTLLIAAHNEERVIEKKVLNSLDLDYPRDRLQIVIASDGSTDATPEIVARYGERGVGLLHYEQRQGKSALLNAAVADTEGDILVMSDANTDYDRAAIRRLVRWFADPQVDVVCGRLVLHDPQGSQNVDGIYWRYETFLKKCEGRLGALLGANGAIYAIRRAAYVPIPGNTLIDDFVIPLLSKLRHNGRIVYDPEAVASEETPPTTGSEFRRRVRIGTGAYQSLVLLWPLLSPRFGWTAFAFFSHKLLRWLVPFFMLGMLAANLVLLARPLYQALLLAQLAVGVVAVTGMYLRGGGLAGKLARGVTMFLAMNVALFFGFWRWLTSTPTGVWQRTTR